MHDKRAFSTRASINIVCHHVGCTFALKSEQQEFENRRRTPLCRCVDEAAEEATRGMQNTWRLIGSVKHEGQPEKAGRPAV